MTLYPGWQEPRTVTLPDAVVLGDGAAGTVGETMERMGVAPGKVLFVVDAGVQAAGLAHRPLDALTARGFDPVVFGDVRGEPDETIAERLAALARSHVFGAVVGMGGGSALDLAKLAAALATNPGPVRAFVGQERFTAPARPSLLLPTTAGTGSEVTRNAILSIDGKKAVFSSRHLRPTTALLDPLLTVSLPPAVTAATGLDALTHAIEPYMSTFANPLTDEMALAAMRLISGALPGAYRGGDLTARRDMLLGAHLSGYSLSASTLLGHSIAYTIANRTHLAHGVTCAMALPYCLAFNAKAAAQRLASVATTILGPQRGDVASLIAWARDLCVEFAIPTSLAEVGIPEAELDAMADECVTRYPRPNNPAPLDRDRVGRLYRLMWATDTDALLRFAFEE